MDNWRHQKLISKIFSKEFIDASFVNYFLSVVKAILQKNDKQKNFSSHECL